MATAKLPKKKTAKTPLDHLREHAGRLELVGRRPLVVPVTGSRNLLLGPADAIAYQSGGEVIAADKFETRENAWLRADLEDGLVGKINKAIGRA